MTCYFTITKLDPDRLTTAEFGFDHIKTDQYGCTHRIDAYDGPKHVSGTVHKGDASAQQEIDILKKRGFTELKS